MTKTQPGKTQKTNISAMTKIAQWKRKEVATNNFKKSTNVSEPNFPNPEKKRRRKRRKRGKQDNATGIPNKRKETNKFLFNKNIYMPIQNNIKKQKGKERTKLNNTAAKTAE